MSALRKNRVKHYRGRENIYFQSLITHLFHYIIKQHRTLSIATYLSQTLFRNLSVLADRKKNFPPMIIRLIRVTHWKLTLTLTLTLTVLTPIFFATEKWFYSQPTHETVTNKLFVCLSQYNIYVTS